MENVTLEQVAHAVLDLVAHFPGEFGRLRCSRIVGGYTVPVREDVPGEMLTRYITPGFGALQDYVGLVDAMLQGGLLTNTSGPRPRLVLTLPGFRALKTLGHVKA